MKFIIKTINVFYTLNRGYLKPVEENVINLNKTEKKKCIKLR